MKKKGFAHSQKKRKTFESFLEETITPEFFERPVEEHVYNITYALLRANLEMKEGVHIREFIKWRSYAFLIIDELRARGILPIDEEKIAQIFQTFNDNIEKEWRPRLEKELVITSKDFDELLKIEPWATLSEL